MKKKLNILVIHGANLNMLGKREKTIYGSLTLKEIEKKLNERAKELGCDLEYFHSNVEGEIVNAIQESLNVNQGIVINPGAYTHTSIAIRDALLAVNIPFVEVHLSNIYKREEFRKHSYLSDIAVGQISGFLGDSYVLGLSGLFNFLNHK